MKYKARVDRNQKQIVQALTQIGCTVEQLHAVGKGVPDLLVGYHGRNWLIEVKDGERIPSERKLTDVQVEWHVKWRGQVSVVNSVDEAISLVTQ